MWKSGDIITYTGRNRISNLVIQQLQSTHDAKNRGGFTFTATLKQVTLGSSVDSGTASTMAGMDAAASASQPKATTKAGAEVFLPNLQHQGGRPENHCLYHNFIQRLYVLCKHIQQQTEEQRGADVPRYSQQHREEVTDHAAY